MVADGIGGRKGGAVASGLVVEGIRAAVAGTPRVGKHEVTGFLSSIVDRLNSQIIKWGQDDEECEGMGTTLNCLLFVGGRLHLAHIGDSRTYLLWKEHFWQMTLDHNVSSFVERGLLPRDVAKGQSSGALVRSIGLAPQVEPDIYEYELQGGEMFLTCSDGLTSMLEDRRIYQLLRQHGKNFQKLPRILIDEANRAGGRDNITVLVTEVDAR